MRPKCNEVLAGLKLHAVGQGNAIRPNDLATRLSLPPKTVSNALNWLAVEGKHPQVRRERAYKTYWYRYWIEN
jgi:hypothetical protein